MSGAQLSIIVPTFKERGNVAELARRLDLALQGLAWEAIYVDDNSPDGTAAAVKELAAADPRVRCLRRVGRRGLAGACIEGMLSSAAPNVAVIDADLQHDEKVLPAMLARLERGEADLVAATRYVAGGNAAAFSASRGAISRLATALTRRLVGTPFLEGYEALLQAYGTDYTSVAERYADEPRMREWFGEGWRGTASFDHRQLLDFEALRGRLMSSSYAPQAGHPKHEPMMEALRTLFDACAVDGHISFDYDTRVYVGEVP